MFDRAFIKTAINPLHKGHEYLFLKAQEYSKVTDIWIGNRDKNDRLPRHIRAKSVKEFIRKRGMGGRFNVLECQNFEDLNYNQYDLFVAGSDLITVVANKTIETPRFPFPNILSIHRNSMPLTKEARKKLKKYTNLIEEKGTLNTSSTKIRQAYQQGKDISQMVSETTWEIIKDHVHIFKN